MQSSSTLALIGGTSLLDHPRFQGAQTLEVATDYGVVTLLARPGLLFLQRHGMGSYTPPHRINHHANLQALKRAGATGVLALGSVGSLQEAIRPGTFVLPDDFFAPQVNPTFFDDKRGHQTPGFDIPWRTRVFQAYNRLSPPGPPLRNGGVYWQTQGPRFETPAEIRAHQGI
ncbi:MAG: hypothetical protein H7831_16645, partial [Magnetococcus sp. WYHC-3]